jgi:hypothetical protein
MFVNHFKIINTLCYSQLLRNCATKTHNVRKRHINKLRISVIIKLRGFFTKMKVAVQRVVHMSLY